MKPCSALFQRRTGLGRAPLLLLRPALVSSPLLSASCSALPGFDIGFAAQLLFIFSCRKGVGLFKSRPSLPLSQQNLSSSLPPTVPSSSPIGKAMAAFARSFPLVMRTSSGKSRDRREHLGRGSCQRGCWWPWPVGSVGPGPGQQRTHSPALQTLLPDRRKGDTKEWTVQALSRPLLEDLGWGDVGDPWCRRGSSHIPTTFPAVQPRFLAGQAAFREEGGSG